MSQYKLPISAQLFSIIEEHRKSRLGLAFCAPSGTGKTTFLRAVVQELLQDKKMIPSEIGVIKMSHHPIDCDSTNKDCQQYRNLGVDVLVTNSTEEANLFLQAAVAKNKICLVEGGRRLNIPSIVLQRKGFLDRRWTPPKNVVLSLELKS